MRKALAIVVAAGLLMTALVGCSPSVIVNKKVPKMSEKIPHFVF